MAVPTDFSGLRLWLKLDVLALSDGDGIGSWTDSSGLGNHFTQGTAGSKPVYKTSILNDLPIVRFDGADDYLTGPDLMSGATAGEVFIMVKIDGDPPAAPQTGFWDFGTSLEASHFPWNTGVIYEEWGTDTRKTTVNPTPLLSAKFYVYNVLSAAGNYVTWLDGKQLYSTATNTVGFITAPLLGRSYWSSGPTYYHLDGDVAEVIIYDNDIGSTNRSAIWQYLIDKYFHRQIGNPMVAGF